MVEVQTCDPTTAAMFRLGGIDASRAAKSIFVAELDAEAVRFFGGGRRIKEFLSFTWQEVSKMDVATVSVANGRAAQAVEFHIDRGGSTTVLPLVIKATRGVTGFKYSSPAEITEHFKVLEMLWAPHKRADASMMVALLETSPASQVPRRRMLRAGLSSTTQLRAGGAFWVAAATFLLAMLPFGILTWTHVWIVPSGVFLPLLYLALSSMVVGKSLRLFVPLKVSKELTTGYTLSREGDINVDQLDPKTGYVIRQAGNDTLTVEQEQSALAIVRAL